MLIPCLTTSENDLQQILFLQQQNLKQNISKDEMEQQGFVTLRHDMQTLSQMHTLAPTVIIKDENKIVAYALTMLRECRAIVPALEPMFRLFDTLSWNNKPLKKTIVFM